MYFINFITEINKPNKYGIIVIIYIYNSPVLSTQFICYNKGGWSVRLLIKRVVSVILLFNGGVLISIIIIVIISITIIFVIFTRFIIKAYLGGLTY